MRKIVFAVVAAIAISFASCGNKTQQAVTPDSAANSPQALVELIDDDIAEISELVEKKDTAQLKTALNDMKGKLVQMIVKNPDAVKQYVANLQQYLKENSENIKAVIGDNEALNATLNALSDADAAEVASKLSTVVSAISAADEPSDSTKEAISKKLDEAKKLLGK